VGKKQRRKLLTSIVGLSHVPDEAKPNRKATVDRTLSGTSSWDVPGIEGYEVKMVYWIYLKHADV
jgi:hypothetical protein